MLRKIMAGVLATLVAGSVFAVDGTMIADGGQWVAHNWSSAKLWDYDIVAKNGGTAIFSGSGSWNNDPQREPKRDCFYQDISGLTLSGWDIGKILTSQEGEDVTMVGDKPYLSSSIVDSVGSAITLQLKGNGSNTLVKRGSGNLVINTPVQDFAAVEIAAGKLYVTNSASPIITADESAKVVLAGGGLAYSPKHTTGAAAATVNNVKVDVGRSEVAIAKGDTSSATLTMGSLERSSGGILDVVPTAVANLGSSEKIKITGAAASTAPDVTRIVRNGNEYQFLGYDTNNGLVPATDTIPAYAAGATVDEATSATVVKAAGNLTAAATLTLGDDETPGAMVVGSSTDAKNSSFTVKGDVVFPCEGVVYRPVSTKGETKLYFTPDTLTATGGVTFVSKCSSGTRPVVYVSTNAVVETAASELASPGWTVPIRLIGVQLGNVRNTTFGKGAEIWVGDSDSTSSSYMQICNQYKLSGSAGTLDLTHYYDLHLCGIGGGSGYGAIQHNKSYWQNSTWTHSGRVFLHNDSWIKNNSAAVSLFCGPISGAGGLTIEGGTFEMRGTNTFTGTLKTYSAANIVVRNGGTLGAGKVELADGSRLVFNDRQETLAVGNQITMAGSRFVVQNSNIELTGDTSVKTVVVQQNGNLGIGATLTAQSAELDGNATITATENDGCLVLGANDSTTNRIAAVLSDGSKGGKLSFIKDGTNTVEVFGHNTYSGKTIIKGGTLRLASNLWDIPDLSYWLDADDDSTITTNDDGEITEWRSKVGSYKFARPTTNVSESKSSNRYGIAFSSGPANLPHYSQATFNGHKSIRFRGSTSTTNLQERLAGSEMCQQRTIFIVARSLYEYYSQSQGAVFGTNNQDQWARCGNTSAIGVNNTDSGSVATSAGYGYQNGVKTTSIYSNFEQRADDETTTPNVMTLLRPRAVLAGTYTLYTTFLPAIGGCVSDGRGWGGDYCEIIAFSRTLTDPERKSVENYLMKKWNPQKLSGKYHPESECVIPEAVNLLPTNTDLELHTGSVLDLNGISQTVRTMYGEGTVINTSTNAAVLTITEGGDFHGTIKGNIKVVRTRSAVAGADNVALLIREGGTFVADGVGVTTFSAYNPAPVTNGIAFWLDASYSPSTTMVEGEGGYLTSWKCRQAGEKIAQFTQWNAKPTGKYSPTGFNGCKPAVNLDDATSRMLSRDSAGANGSETVRTVFIAAYNRRIAANPNCRYTFGPWNLDEGFQATAQEGDATCSLAFAGLVHYGDTVRINGVDYSSVKPVANQIVNNPYMIAIRINDSHADNYIANYKDKNWALGAYGDWVEVCANVFFGEVIAYTNALSDYEFKLVENYMLRKWITSGASWPTEETQAFDSTCGLGVSGGAQIDFNGADLTLASVAGSGGGFTNFKTLTVTDRIDLLLDGNNCVTSLDIGSADSRVTFGTEANEYKIPVNLTNASQINRLVHRQNAVKVTGELENGTLTFANPPKGWRFLKDGLNPLWFFLHNGTMLLIR